eukprot:TRINITY_DN1106_c1_g2_i5.p4 TRINITY_DN1106_c1_g2~~TRINITY_DN1106_c1_g2_i5.p4  ORF type:complete len:164 (-),score=15.87 TRINITY_DN1106_c1_g2_i5:461-952(-)
MQPVTVASLLISDETRLLSSDLRRHRPCQHPQKLVESIKTKQRERSSTQIDAHASASDLLDHSALAQTTGRSTAPSGSVYGSPKTNQDDAAAASSRVLGARRVRSKKQLGDHSHPTDQTLDKCSTPGRCASQESLGGSSAGATRHERYFGDVWVSSFKVGREG